MLHIILLILKIIGTIILIILGLLLLIVLIVLLVPIRYKVAIEHGEVFSLKGNVSWLLHIIHASITMKDTKPHFKLRIFGYIFFDNLNPKPPKAKKKRNKKEKKKKNKKKNKNGTSKNKKTNKLIDTKLNNDKNKDKDNQTQSTSTESIPVKSQLIELSQEGMKQEEPKEAAATRQVNKELNPISNASDQEETYRQSADTAKQSLFQKAISKLINIKEKIVGFFIRTKEKIVEFFKRTKEKILSILQDLSDIQHKIGLISTFINDEMNRAGMKRTFKSLKKLIKHILPTKLKSKVIFGTGDPCSTGQLLGLCAILYSFYGDNMQITPDFQNARFEGQHYAKGRIRVITLLFIVIKLMLDKRFKQLKGNLLILKEAL